MLLLHVPILCRFCCIIVCFDVLLCARFTTVLFLLSLVGNLESSTQMALVLLGVICMQNQSRNKQKIVTT